jgi:hypothetical protein
MQVSMAVVGIAAAILFAVSELADWRRRNRKDVDKVGFMPWRGLALISAATALFATALWISQGGGL